MEENLDKPFSNRMSGNTYKKYGEILLICIELPVPPLVTKGVLKQLFRAYLYTFLLVDFISNLSPQILVSLSVPILIVQLVDQQNRISY